MIFMRSGYILDTHFHSQFHYRWLTTNGGYFMPTTLYMDLQYFFDFRDLCTEPNTMRHMFNILYRVQRT